MLHVFGDLVCCRAAVDIDAIAVMNEFAAFAGNAVLLFQLADHALVHGRFAEPGLHELNPAIYFSIRPCLVKVFKSRRVSTEMFSSSVSSVIFSTFRIVSDSSIFFCLSSGNIRSPIQSALVVDARIHV